MAKPLFDPTPMPRFESVHPLAVRCVQVVWAAGTRAGMVDVVDLSPPIDKYRVYAALRSNPKLFETVTSAGNGQMLEWSDGELQMAATTVEHLANEQSETCSCSQ